MNIKIGSVLVTGANRGIGLEFVKQLVNLPKPPTVVFATCRDISKAKELQKIASDNSSVKVLQLDVKETEKFVAVREQLEKEIGEDGLNLLINNAGIFHRSALDQLSKETLMETFEVNVVSPLLLAKELLPLLKVAASKSSIKSLSAVRSGIVNITSKMGSIDDNTSGSFYSYRSSKAALNMVTKSLAVDYKIYGISALALHPGWVKTDMGGKSALIDTHTSVQGMLNVILTSTEEHSGFMFGYDGKKIPW